MKAEGYGKSVRSHWGIESRLYWVLDVGFRENGSRIRVGNAAENVDVLHHIGIDILKQEKAAGWGWQVKGRNAVMIQSIFIKCWKG